MRGSTNSYTVEGLETLALREILTMDTEIAPVGSEDFKAIRHWDFAVKVFPVRKPLTVRHADTVALGPVCTALSLAQPKTPGDRHITTMDEIRDIIIRDPNDPQALVLLNGLKDDMRLKGITAPKAFADLFLANQELNRRLKLQVIYRQVSDAVKTNRLAVLLAMRVNGPWRSSVPRRPTSRWLSLASLRIALSGGSISIRPRPPS